MPNYTKNLNLELPFQNEFYDVEILNENFKKIDAIDFEVGATKATFEELKQLVEEKKLSIGAYYILTDYQCTYKQPNTNTIMTQTADENIILTATSENTFSRMAFSDKHKQDIIYFTLDDMLLGSTKENFRGCILRRKDTNWGIDIPYDWRNIKLNRRFINIDDGYKLKEENKQYRIISDLEGKEFKKNELCIFYDKILMKVIKDVKWDETSKIDECFEVIVGDYKNPIWINEENKISDDLTIISKSNKDVSMVSNGSYDIQISDDVGYGYVRDIVLLGMCNRIVIKGATEGVTLEKNDAVEIGSNCRNIIIMDSSAGVKIRNANFSIIIASNSYGVNIEYDNIDVYVGESTYKCYIGNSNEKIYIGKKNKDINIGNSNENINIGVFCENTHIGYNVSNESIVDKMKGSWRETSWSQGVSHIDIYTSEKTNVMSKINNFDRTRTRITKEPQVVNSSDWYKSTTFPEYYENKILVMGIENADSVDVNFLLTDLPKVGSVEPVTYAYNNFVGIFSKEPLKENVKAYIVIHKGRLI